VNSGVPRERTASREPTHRTPAYRRALWVVVGLNLGYGIIEGVGGYLAGSQALKADALDFVGDGLITFLGLVAIRWSRAWRDRIARLQGAFLGALGLAVLVHTVYRAFAQQLPDSTAMGALAAVALVVNLAAAAVLLPHRTGDANVRAVWLFSRNDAISNLAVLAAAALVALLNSPWPDLLVGAVVAALFLHSSWEIMRRAR
jgi:cation diffusion facilitator family transporter